jgi:hypothetical protein
VNGRLELLVEFALHVEGMLTTLNVKNEFLLNVVGGVSIKFAK